MKHYADEVEELLGYFRSSHLPPNLRLVAAEFEGMARYIDNKLPTCLQKVRALERLLEAKDCAVRAALPAARVPGADEG